MLLLRRLLFHTARRLASDPRMRAKAAEAFEAFKHEVKPRAEAAWREIKPKLDIAKAELKDIASEADPRESPRKFATKLKERLIDRGKRD